MKTNDRLIVASHSKRLTPPLHERCCRRGMLGPPFHVVLFLYIHLNSVIKNAVRNHPDLIAVLQFNNMLDECRVIGESELSGLMINPLSF